MGLINCFRCGKSFYKQNRHINEALKFGHKSYCSLSCQYLAKNKRRLLICENPTCINKFIRTPSQTSFHNYCSRACSGVINGPLTALQQKKSKYCKYCGKGIFHKFTYCSMQCWAEEHKLSQEVLLRRIRQISHKLGRSPTRRECSVSTSCYKYFGQLLTFGR